MIKLTATLLESILLIERASGERIFDSLAAIYDNSRGGNAYATELNGLTPEDIRAVLHFMNGAGFDVRLPGAGQVITQQAVRRAITNAVASSSSSSSSSRSAELFDDSSATPVEDDDDEPILDPKTGIKVRRERPMPDDPAASEKVLAGLLGHRSENDGDD